MALGLVVVGLLVSDPAPSDATWPGVNGRLSFYSPSNLITTMDADGSDVVTLSNGTALETDHSWSPSGSRLVYTRPFYGPGGTHEVFMMDADGSNVIQVTANASHDVYPSWSPTETSFIFSSDRDGNFELYEMNLGGGLTRLTFTPENEFEAVISPDNTLIAFVRDNSSLWLMDRAGGNARPLSTGAAHYTPEWSPDSSRVAVAAGFAGGLNIFIVNAVDLSRSQLTSGQGHGPAWSPDGTKIAYVPSSGFATTIRVASVDGTSDVSTNVVGDLPEWVPVRDGTPPTVSGEPDRDANADGWYNAPVLIDWSAVDPPPSMFVPTDPPDTLASFEGAAVVYTSAFSCDAAQNCATGQLSLSIDLTSPVLSVPALSPNPAPAGSTLVVVAEATDAVSGIRAGEFFVGSDPGVGNGSALTISGGSLHGTLAAPLQPGLFTVSVRALDFADNWSAVTSAILVVYDPTAGSARGAGWIVPGGSSSDTGDMLPGLNGTGSDKAHFGFMIEYQNGASTVPNGQLQFRYGVGDFKLVSAAYDWLVVTNQNWVKFQGTAAIDGASGLYPFRVDARDDDSQGDRFIIKIWAPGADPDGSTPLYRASGDVQGQVQIQP